MSTFRTLFYSNELFTAEWWGDGLGRPVKIECSAVFTVGHASGRQFAIAPHTIPTPYWNVVIDKLCLMGVLESMSIEHNCHIPVFNSLEELRYKACVEFDGFESADAMGTCVRRRFGRLLPRKVVEASICERLFRLFIKSIRILRGHTIAPPLSKTL